LTKSNAKVLVLNSELTTTSASGLILGTIKFGLSRVLEMAAIPSAPGAKVSTVPDLAMKLSVMLADTVALPAFANYEHGVSSINQNI
jgi:hypothetical protein